MTSCCVTASTAATASGVGGAALRTGSTASAGTVAGAACASSTIVSTRHHSSYLCASLQTRPISGSVYRSITWPSSLPVARVAPCRVLTTVVTAACSNVSLNCASCARSAGSCTARICTASTAALVEWSRPTTATGTPADIDVIASSASRPLTPPPRSGTPMTGIVTCAAIVAGQAAVDPAAGDDDLDPARLELGAPVDEGAGRAVGLMTVSSYGTPNRPASPDPRHDSCSVIEP